MEFPWQQQSHDSQEPHRSPAWTADLHSAQECPAPNRPQPADFYDADSRPIAPHELLVIHYPYMRGDPTPPYYVIIHRVEDWCLASEQDSGRKRAIRFPDVRAARAYAEFVTGVILDYCMPDARELDMYGPQTMAFYPRARYY